MSRMQVEGVISVGDLCEALVDAHRRAGKKGGNSVTADGKAVDTFAVHVCVRADESAIVGDLDQSILQEIAEEHCTRPHRGDDWGDDEERPELDLQNLQEFAVALIRSDAWAARSLAGRMFTDREREVVERALNSARRAA